MVLSSGNISSIVYKRKVRDDMGDFSLDGQTLIVLMELDGKATLGALAAKTGLSMGSIGVATIRAGLRKSRAAAASMRFVVFKKAVTRSTSSNSCGVECRASFTTPEPGSSVLLRQP